MLEMLVLTFCLYDVECNQLTKAYLSHNVQVKRDAKQVGKYMYRNEPEAALFAVLAYGSLGAKKFRVPVTKNATIEWKFKDDEPNIVTLNYRYDF